MFNDETFRERNRLSAVNSINWARVMAQTVYYFVAAAALGAPWRAVSFTVPTGNFGDIFAAYAARRMGLPIGRLVIATNVNDILDRTMKRGTYRLREVVPTASPSMDIQVSSNFERLLFDAYGRDGSAIRRLMGDLKQSGSFTVDAEPLEWIRAHFASGRTDEDATRETIGRVHRDAGILIDPHTAVGVAAAEAFLEPGIPMVTLATAHPAKFPDVVRESSGVFPALPPWLHGLLEREERYDILPADQFGIERHIERRTRAMRVGV
jgi:threonine synthase